MKLLTVRMVMWSAAAAIPEGAAVGASDIIAADAEGAETGETGPRLLGGIRGKMNVTGCGLFGGWKQPTCASCDQSASKNTTRTMERFSSLLSRVQKTLRCPAGACAGELEQDQALPPPTNAGTGSGVAAADECRNAKFFERCRGQTATPSSWHSYMHSVNCDIHSLLLKSGNKVKLKL